MKSPSKIMSALMRMTCIFGAFVSLSSRASASSYANCQWQVFSSSPYENPAFPESNATYLRTGFPATGTPLHRQVVRIRGVIRGMRYISFTVYDSISNSVRAHIADQDMHLRDDSYEIFVGTRAAISEILGKEAGKHNVLYVGDEAAEFEIWHRNYLGRVEGDTLPRLEFVNLDIADGGGSNDRNNADVQQDPGAGSPVDDLALDCPATLQRPHLRIGALATIPPLNHGHEIRFFRGSGEFMYPNPDNVYLVSRVNELDGDLATIWFRPPPRRFARYWSVCLGGMSTTTSGCLYDREILAANGLDPDEDPVPGTKVRVMFGNEWWRSRAVADKAAFLRWGSHKHQVIIYRNLIVAPEHPGNLSRVPPVSGGGIFECTAFCEGWDRESAEKYIGDWAPSGRQE